MTTRVLHLPSQFGNSHRLVAGLATMLQDHHQRVRDLTNGLTTEQLEWQIRAGHNTIGMLLAHIATAEVYWMQIAAEEIPYQDIGEKRLVEILGINMQDDGVPQAADGIHPETLTGWKLEKYYALLEKALTSTLSSLEKWDDVEMLRDFTVPGRRLLVSNKLWMGYHVLEHLAAHTGQIGLILHLQKDVGLLEK